MEHSPQISIPSFEDPKAELLSPSSEHALRPLSASSARSTITIVDNHSNIPKLDIKQIQRRRTQAAEVKVTWWQCLKGVLFGPQVTERAARKTIIISEVEDEDDTFADTECPWILTVHAVPPERGGKEHISARCTFDTGCLQGNIISKEFALKLGYIESDFKPLASTERSGGISATGHAHIPEGALYIDWYHNSSPRLFNCMRFLVSTNAQYDLIVGAFSICKHKLLSAPNLMVANRRKQDKKLDELKGAAAKLDNEIISLKEEKAEKREKGKEEEARQISAKIHKKDKQLLIAKLEIDVYIAKKASESAPTDEGKKQIWIQKEEALRAAKGQKTDEKATSASRPQVQFSAPNGSTRAPTGSSTGSQARSRKK